MAFLHCYRPHRFNTKASETVVRANTIIDDLGAQGYTLTLRQLYYQFVRRNWVANTEKEYKRLGRIVTDARESGIMDWRALEDRGRSCYGRLAIEDPAAIVSGIEYDLKFDYWSRQDHYLEVWVEKQALENVVARPCSRKGVSYMACKGYLSASEAWRAGQRFQDALARGKECVLIHLADHDPSGLDMTQDNSNRIKIFAEDTNIDVRRIALNMDQVEHYKLPPNPAKMTDSRYKKYIGEYGPESWELDAIEPKALDDLITSTIDEYIDPEIWADVLSQQNDARAPLAALSENWGAVKSFLYANNLV